MKHTKLTLTLGALLAATLVVYATGCGDDDDTMSGTDAGNDVQTTETAPPGDSGGGDTSVVDGGDAGPCKFNDFVTGLITNSTTATALPSVDLGEKCVDDQTPFPSTLF